jgi:O-methyltransferase
MRSETSELQRFKHKLVERIAVWSNRYLYKHHLWWIHDQSWLEPYRKAMEHDPSLRRPQVRKLDRRFTLIEFSRFVRRLRGSTAECGVARGVGSAITLTALDGTYAAGEKHYAFDAFAGLPPPTEADRMRSGKFGWTAGDIPHEQALAQEAIAPFGHAELRVGWIPETFHGLEDERFRFVHVDVDLHQPTWDSLEFFYPRLVTGGVILLDDHGLETCPGARKAAIDYFAATNDAVLDLPTGQGLVIKLALSP